MRIEIKTPPDLFFSTLYAGFEPEFIAFEDWGEEAIDEASDPLAILIALEEMLEELDW